LADIFYLPNFGCFDKTGVFQQTQAKSLIEVGFVSECVILTLKRAMVKRYRNS